MLAFIVNPNSGGGRGSKIWKTLERYLEKKKIEYKIFITDGPGDAAAISGKLTEGCPDEDITVVAVGGDGTLNEVLDGLHISGQVTLGFIPTGTGNDFAMGVRLPVSPRRCLKRILHPREIRMMDYGVLTYGEEGRLHRRFIVSSGAGFDAAVNVELKKLSVKQKLSAFALQNLSYLFAGAGCFIKFRPVKGYVVLNGVKKVEFNHIFFISAHIHPTEGGGYIFAPKADDEDGELTLCIVHNRSKRQLARIMISSKFGNHLKYAGVRTYNCTEMTVHTDEPVPVHTDGELCGEQTDFEIRCVKQKLRVLM